MNLNYGLVLAGVLPLVACSSSSSGSVTSHDASTDDAITSVQDGASMSDAAFDVVTNFPPFLDSGVALCGATMSDPPPNTSCTSGAQCIYCIDNVAGAFCSCGAGGPDAGDADSGKIWLCVGTEHPCQ